MSNTESKAAVAPPPGADSGGARSVLAKDFSASMTSVPRDNTAALLGMTGVKYTDGQSSTNDLRYDANGNSVKTNPGDRPSLKPESGFTPLGGDPGNPMAGQLGEQGQKDGAGEAYRKMSQKLEEQRQELARAEAHRQAMATKQQIVEQIRRGNAPAHLFDELARLNKDVFNLPADHTGY